MNNPINQENVLKWFAGIASAAATIILTFSINIAKDTEIALEVAKQHGEELLMIRGEISSLRAEMARRTQKRYTSEDAVKDFNYVNNNLNRIEGAINEHLSNHAAE